MTALPSPTWEAVLLDWAYSALEAHQSAVPHRDAADPHLKAAYALCEQITLQNSRTFHLASGLLPPGKREAARALYAFCRVTDDLVDEAAQDCRRRTSLELWRSLLRAPHPPVEQQVALAWADARSRYNIPAGYAEQLIDGVARDLDQTRYRTFDELAAYSYGVASTVGLMAMHIIGFKDESALPYAVKLGVALQVTNILRDVGEDWRCGRVYLPAEELAAFGLDESVIAEARYRDPRWQAFMRFQIARNRQLYAEGLPGIALLKPEGRFAIAAAAQLYRAILTDIERHDYDVFSRRAHIGKVGKIARLPAIWWASRAARIS